MSIVGPYYLSNTIFEVKSSGSKFLLNVAHHTWIRHRHSSTILMICDQDGIKMVSFLKEQNSKLILPWLSNCCKLKGCIWDFKAFLRKLEYKRCIWWIWACVGLPHYLILEPLQLSLSGAYSRTWVLVRPHTHTHTHTKYITASFPAKPKYTSLLLRSG